MKHQISHYEFTSEFMPPLQSILDNYTLFIQAVVGYYREIDIKIPETCEISWKALQISHVWNNYHANNAKDQSDEVQANEEQQSPSSSLQSGSGQVQSKWIWSSLRRTW